MSGRGLGISRGIHRGWKKEFIGIEADAWGCTASYLEVHGKL